MQKTTTNSLARAITVKKSVPKLDWQDLSHENMSKFDGTMVYAQNKRQQVVRIRRE